MATGQLRVLLAENRQSEAGIILRSLCAEAGWSLELIFLGERAKLVHALTTHCPELALVDFSMLQPDAPALLRVLHRTCPSIPLILFADPADKACVVNCLSMGASDFLLEGFMDERTMSRVLRAAVAGAPAGAPRHSLPGKVSISSNHCPSLLATPPGPQSSVTSGDVCALTVSVENFEHVRFWMGTLAVDRMLREMAQVLKKCVRTSDEVMTLSHGQLGITFHNVGESCSPAILKRIRAKVKSHLPIFRLNPSPVLSIHEGNVAPVSPSFLPPSLPSTPGAADSLPVSQAAD